MNEPIMVVKTPTVEDLIVVVEWALDQKKVWASGSKSIDKSTWIYHKAGTCIVIRENIITYCNINYAHRSFSTKILDMKQFYKQIGKFYNDKFGMKFGLR